MNRARPASLRFERISISVPVSKSSSTTRNWSETAGGGGGGGLEVATIPTSPAPAIATAPTAYSFRPLITGNHSTGRRPRGLYTTVAGLGHRPLHDASIRPATVADPPPAHASPNAARGGWLLCVLEERRRGFCTDPC